MDPTSMQRDAEVLERISDGVFVLDREWRFLYINSAGAHLIERTVESLVGRVIWDEFPEIVGTHVEDEYRRAMHLQKPTDFNNYYEPLSRWYNVRVFPSPDGLTVIYQDFSERHADDEAIDALLEQLQRQRRLVTVLAETNEVVFRATSIDELFHAAVSVAVEYGGFVGAWIAVLDPVSQRLVDVAHVGEGMDQYLADILVTSRDEPHGRGIGGRAIRLASDQFSSDIDSDPTMSPWRDAAARVGYRSSGALPLSVNGEIRGLLSVYAKERSYFNEEERSLVHRLAANVAYGWDARVREDALRESDVARRTAQRFHLVLSSAPDAILGLNHNGQIEMANDRVLELLGWPIDEMVGQSIEDLITHGSDNEPASPWFLRLCELLPDQATVNFTARRRNGTCFPAEVALSSFKESGGESFILSVHDLTERIELEEQGRQRALQVEREEQNRLDSLGHLSGGVAHDFNNLLGVILNYLTLIERQELLSHTRDDVAQVKAAAQRGVALTRQLLAFARREPVNTGSTDITAALHSIATLLESSLGPLVSLRMELPSDPLLASIGPEQLDQIIVNLAINAQDAMPAGGQLTIRAEPQSDTELPVLIRVRDNGIGMTPDIVSRVFEPFFTTKSRGYGTGLGLATVYGVVNRAGGRVTVDSRPGGGTTFEIRLPAPHEFSVVDLEVEAANQPPRQLAPGTRLLFVENDPALRDATRRILSDEGYLVHVATDGLDALKVLEEFNYDFAAVISDVVMPGLSGIELAEQLELNVPQLPVLLMSGYDSVSSPNKRPILLKPVDHDTFLRAVEGIIHDA